MNTFFLVILSTIIISARASAQAVFFDYDASGNQIERRADISVQSKNESNIGNKLASQKVSLVTAYPNPASTHLTIKIADECQGWNLAIYDQADHAVYQCKVTTTEIDLDVSTYVPATYAIRLVSGNKLETFTFVKL